MTVATPESFMAAVPGFTGSNTAWGQRYSSHVRQVITHAAEHAPRSMQRHLGPSELGESCHRNIVAKLVAAVQPDNPWVAQTNHVADKWPAIIGTSVHAWLADVFTRENDFLGVSRYLTEMRVSPTPEHPGSTDLYDAAEMATVDWKILGPTTLNKIRSGNPPRKYRVQLLLYGLGCQLAGLPVKRVVIAALPRTAPNLNDLYIWDHPVWSEEDAALLYEVLRVTEIRKQIAQEVIEGKIHINDVPIVPDDTNCFFCSQYRPQSAKDGQPGCPGTIGNRDLIGTSTF